MTYSEEPQAWDAGNGTWFRAENTDGWRVVRYTGNPADPLAVKHAGLKTYESKERANRDAEKEAENWKVSYP
jgi:hypothetical protein